MPKELNQWPKVNEETVKNSEIKMVVQINGKTRDILNVKRNLEEGDLIDIEKSLPKDINWILQIEGHTDNDKITGSIGGGIDSNWDLSTKRATAIVNILAENKAIADMIKNLYT